MREIIYIRKFACTCARQCNERNNRIKLQNILFFFGINEYSPREIQKKRDNEKFYVNSLQKNRLSRWKTKRIFVSSFNDAPWDKLATQAYRNTIAELW